MLLAGEETVTGKNNTLSRRGRPLQRYLVRAWPGSARFRCTRPCSGPAPTAPSWPRALHAAAGRHRIASQLERCALAWRSNRRRPGDRHSIADALALVADLRRRRRPGHARYALHTLHLVDVEQLATWCASRFRGNRAFNAP